MSKSVWPRLAVNAATVMVDDLSHTHILLSQLCKKLCEAFEKKTGEINRFSPSVFINLVQGRNIVQKPRCKVCAFIVQIHLEMQGLSVLCVP